MRTLTSRRPGTPGAPAPRRIGLRLIASLLGAVVAALLIGRGSLWLFDSVIGADEDTTAAVVVAAVYLCVAAALLFAFARTRTDREQVLGLVPPPPGGLRTGALAWVGAYGVAAVLYLAGALVGFSPAAVVEVLLGVGADNGRLADASVAVALVILFRVCVVVPIAEELLFRGALFAWLRTRLSATWTIAITGVLFGLMHQVPAFIPLAVIVGLGAGWARARTGSTTVPIVVHAVQNVVVVLASLVATGWDARLPMG